MTDLLLTIAHHLLVFSLVAVLAAEVVLLRGPLQPAALRLLGRLDAGYGGLAMGIIAIGFLRVFYGAKGPAFFLHNPVFWAKMAAFAAVGLLSALPTVRILGWRKKQAAEAGFVPAPADVASVRRFMHAEAVMLALVPILAAAMVRGYGYH